MHTNEKLTQQVSGARFPNLIGHKRIAYCTHPVCQLLHANEKLVEFEDRAQQYEAQLLRLQDIVHRLSNKSRRQSLSLSLSHSPQFATSSANNADVLSQTEALLDQILSSPGLANLDLATTIDAQERRSFMVEACQQELQDAVNEFHDLVGKTGATSEGRADD